MINQDHTDQDDPISPKRLIVFLEPTTTRDEIAALAQAAKQLRLVIAVHMRFPADDDEPIDWE